MKTFEERMIESKKGCKQMDEAEAIIYLIWSNQWRIGKTDEMPEPSKVTEAINTIVKEYKKRNL
jgi:hypothetical protein